MIEYKHISIPSTIDEWELYRTSDAGAVRALTNCMMRCIDSISDRAFDDDQTIINKSLRRFERICEAYSKFGASDSEPVQIGCEVLSKAIMQFMDKNISTMELYYKFRGV